MLARLKGSLNRVQAGDYLISTGWTPDQVLRQITEGKVLLYRLSVREGLTWWETAAAVEQQGFARFEDFRNVIRDPRFLREHNIPFADAEGFLFPETYFLPKPRAPLDREQAWATASHMVGMFWKKTQALWSDPSFMKKSAVSRQGDASEAAGADTNAADTKTAGATGVVAQAAGTAGADTKTAGTDINAGGAAGADTNAASAAGGGQIAPAVLPMPAPTEGPAPPAGDARASQEPGGPAAAAPPASPANGPRSPAEVDEDALRRLVILASLVEKETGLPRERGLVAGVFANRLRLGMLLQCDPTIVYGMGGSFRGRIRRSHIEDEKNPYNTYRHAGLPPGPICSPGLEALKAAFAPTGHDFLFFVARDTGEGHNFSKTLDEHNRAVQLYRARPRGGNTP
jgi:cell division protein YceG involved in septum cleavage